VDVNLPLRMMTNLVVMFIGLLWVRSVAQKNDLKEVEPWQ